MSIVRSMSEKTEKVIKLVQFIYDFFISYKYITYAEMAQVMQF